MLRSEMMEDQTRVGGRSQFGFARPGRTATIAGAGRNLPFPLRAWTAKRTKVGGEGRLAPAPVPCTPAAPSRAASPVISSVTCAASATARAALAPRACHTSVCPMRAPWGDRAPEPARPRRVGSPWGASSGEAGTNPHAARNRMQAHPRAGDLRGC